MQTDAYIPRRLDDQWKIGFWDVDIAAPVLFCFCLGWISGSRIATVVLLFAGVMVSRWMSRMKSDKHPAFARHWIYWYLPATPLNSLRRTPPASVGRMIG